MSEIEKRNEIENIFDGYFKYKVNQQLRHRGDTKSFSPDMGLLVLNRIFIESTDDDDNKIYERLYQCRMVRFSNSGDLQNFREKELMSVEEWEEENLKEDQRRADRRFEIKARQEEIFKLFDVVMNTPVHLPVEKVLEKCEIYSRIVSHGEEFDTTTIYRVCGWGMAGKPYITVKECLIDLEKEVAPELIQLDSPKQFQKV